MEYWLLVIIGILAFAILVLAARLFFIRKAAREIETEFTARLSTETNTLLGISSRDRQMRRLAASLNGQLKAMRAMRHRYEQGDLELRDAITNISHDLRTPLTAIRGYLDLLEREDLTENSRHYLSLIKGRTEALKALAEELFQYSVSAELRELSPSRVDLGRALTESLLSYHAVMRQANITPDIRLPEQPVWRYLDTAALGRIFGNIINNAIKYSDGDFFVLLLEDGTITFSNTALALNAVSAGRLFERFYTVENGQGSTGLGLSIARLLTERMGGSISADYQGERLSVTVRFPAASNLPPTP